MSTMTQWVPAGAGWQRNLGRAARDAAAAVAVGVLIGLACVHSSQRAGDVPRTGGQGSLAGSQPPQARLAQGQILASGGVTHDAASDAASGFPGPGRGAIGMLVQLDEEVVVQVSNAYFEIGMPGVDSARCHVTYTLDARRERLPVITVSGTGDSACP